MRAKGITREKKITPVSKNKMSETMKILIYYVHVCIYINEIKKQANTDHREKTERMLILVLDSSFMKNSTLCHSFLRTHYEET